MKFDGLGGQMDDRICDVHQVRLRESRPEQESSHSLQKKPQASKNCWPGNRHEHLPTRRRSISKMKYHKIKVSISSERKC